MSIYEENFADLDVSLDNLDKLPEFITPPAGVITARMNSWEKKTLNEKPFLSMNFSFLSAVELEDELAEIPNAGAEFSILNGLTKTENMKYDPRVFINKTLEDVNKTFGESKLSAILDRLVGKDVVLLISINAKGYASIKKMSLA